VTFSQMIDWIQKNR